MADSLQKVESMETENQSEDKTKRNVLIAMDCSKHAINAFEWFVEHVYNKDTDNVIMAHCAELNIKLPTAALMGSPATVHAMTQEYQEHLKEKLAIIDKLANDHNIQHKLEVVDKHHKPGEAIVKAAEQQNVHLIIVGSRGMGTVRRTILGSVSDYVIHHAHVPVIVCKHEDEHHKLK